MQCTITTMGTICTQKRLEIRKTKRDINDGKSSFGNIYKESFSNSVFSIDSNVVSENNEQSSDQNVCDGNQNLNSTAVIAAVTDAKLMKKANKNLKNSFIDFMKAEGD